MDPQRIVHYIYDISAHRNLNVIEDVTRVGERGCVLPVEKIRHDFVD